MTSFTCARALRVCALLALPASVSAQSRQSRQSPTIFSPASQMGTVSVRAAVVLADYSVKPLPLLNVVARRTDRSDSVSAQTDLDGRVTLPLRVGTYTVRAKAAQLIAGKSYTWSVLVTVRPSRAELVQLTNTNASVDSAATTATVAAAPAAPAASPAAAEPTRPVATTPKPTPPEKVVALEKPVAPAAPPASVEPTRPVAMTPKPASEKVVALEKPVATPKKVAEAPAPTPVTAPATPPAKALATVPATAPAKAPATAPAKAPATAPAKAPVTGPEKALAAAPAKTPATAPAKAPASGTTRAEPTPFAPPTKPVAVAPTQAPAPARTQRVQPRVNTSNLLLGLSFDASSIKSAGLGPSTGTGVGVAGQLGWGVGKYFALVADASGARIGSLNGNFDLAHLDVGGRVHFVTARRAFVPFVEGGYAWRVVRKEEVVMSDPAGNTYTGDMMIGTGFSLGGGLQYFVAPTVAFGGAFKWTTGTFSRLQRDGLYVDGLAMDATSTRVNMGFTWYPMGR